MIRYMVLYTHLDQPGSVPTVTVVDCNIHNLEEAQAEAEWYINQNEVDRENVSVVEYRE